MVGKLPMIIAVFVFTLPVSAQEASPLEMVPQNATVVVRLAAPETTFTSLEEFVNRIQPGFGGVAKIQALNALGQAIFNPEFRGVDQTKDWYLVISVEGVNSQDAFLIVPVTDAQQMKDAAGDRLQYLDKDGYVVCAKNEASIKAVQECLDGDVDSFTTQLDQRSTVQFMKSQLGVAVNAPSLKQAFASELDSAEDTLDAAIDKMGEQMTQGNPELDFAYVLDMYRDFGRVILQAVRDSQSAVVAINVTDEALEIEELLTVAEGSATDKFLQTQPTSDMARIRSLPAGQLSYWSLSGDPKVLLNWSRKLLSQVYKEEAAKETGLKMLALVEEMEFGATSGGIGIQSDTADGALHFYGASEISPAAKMREAFGLIGEGLEYNVGGIRQTQSFEAAAETIDGQPVDLFRMKQEVPAALDPTGLQKALTDKLYGPDGMTQRIMVKDNVMFQTMGGGLESMKELLSEKPWSDAKLLAARARQHEKANLLILGDLPNGVLSMFQMVLSTGTLPIPLPITADQLNDLEIPPSYAGFSAAAEPRRLHVRTTIPAETFQGFVQIGMFVQRVFSGGQ